MNSQEIRSAMQVALLGEIYPKIRAIAYAYSSEKKSFLLRFYLDSSPTDDDYENVSTVMTEFISNFRYSLFEELQEECEYSPLPKAQLDPLDGMLFFRKETF